MAYAFDQIIAADPSNPERVASQGVVTIFAPGDTTQTPLTITTLEGFPLENPIKVNDQGYGPAFMHATLDQVAWSGGGFSGLFVSYKGMKEVAVAAQEGAGNAALSSANSALSAQAAIAAAAGAEERAAASALAAERAAAAAAGAAGGAAFAADPANPGLYFFTTGGQISPDPANPGLYLVGA